MPQISVIVPVYKVEPYLHQCVNSVLAQTFTDFELILVDDGSPDNCGAICDEYAEKDSRVRVIHKENGGVSSARNAGLDAAAGNYICFVDSDDTIAPVFLETAYDRVMKDSLDLYMTGIARVNQKGELQKRYQLPDAIFCKEKLHPDVFVDLLRYCYTSTSCSKLYSRELLQNIRFDTDMCFGEDLKFVWTVLRRMPKIYAAPEISYFYYKNPNGLIATVTRDKCSSMRKLYHFIFQYDQEYWNRKDDTYFMFCRERWANDYSNTMNRIIADSHSSLAEKYAMFRTLCHDRFLRQALIRNRNGRLCFSDNLYFMLVRYTSKRMIKTVFGDKSIMKLKRAL